MEQLKGIISRTQPLTASVSLTTRSAKPVDDATGLALLTMMAEAQAAKPNQTLPEGTPDMYLREWEEIVQRFGLTIFRDGLWKALRSSSFFPESLDIEAQCQSIAQEANADRALARIKAEEQAFRDSGEERTNVADLMREVLQRQAAKKEPVPVPRPATLCCPQCSWEFAVSGNVESWTAAQCRSHADTLDELQRLADKNRGIQ